MTDDLRTRAFKFITRNRAGALATVGEENIPDIATVYCLVLRDLSLYFATRVESRKFRNLMQRPTAALAFSDMRAIQTIQLAGEAQRVESNVEEQDIFAMLMMQRHKKRDWSPPVLKLYERGFSREIAIIHVVPHELTYANFKASLADRYKPFFQKVI